MWSFIPFRKFDTAKTTITAALVRMTTRWRANNQTVSHHEAAISGPDGEIGTFLPTSNPRCDGVLIPTTVAKISNGLIRVPVMLVGGKRHKRPAKELLRTWVPANGEFDLLEVDQC